MATKMYVPQKYRSKTSEELSDYVEYEVLNAFTWDVFLMIDYNNHHKDDDYNGGLSFIDRINEKLGWFYRWDIDELKKNIKSEKDYINTICSMLDDEGCCMYGLHYIENGF